MERVWSDGSIATLVVAREVTSSLFFAMTVAS